MENKIKISLTSILNMLLVYCLMRFGLVFTAGFALFELTFVVLIGVSILFIQSLVSKQYLGQLLKGNVLFLTLNILLVVFVGEIATRGDYSAAASNYSSQLIILFLLWGFYLYIKSLDGLRRRRLVLVYLAAVIISTVYTFYVAMSGPNDIIRNTAFSQYDSEYPLIYGGFDFVYGLVIVYEALFVVLVEGKGRIAPRAKVMLIALLTFLAAMIIVSGFTTAFVLILMCTLLQIPKSKYMKAFVVLLLTCSVMVVPQLLVSLLEMIPHIPDITSGRISELLMAIANQGVLPHLSGDGQRLDRLVWSIQAFWRHPLLGVYASGGDSTLGGHTEWIDQLARYGLLTAICNLGFWLNTYSHIKRVSREASITRKCIKGAFGIYLILGFMNPISMVVTSAPLFVLCPFVEELFVSADRK